jgi:hypothetical protein
MTMPDTIIDDYGPAPQADESEISARIAPMVEHLANLYRQLEAETEALDKTTKTIENVETKLLPALLDELGLPMVGLPDGTMVSKEEEIHASLPKGDQERLRAGIALLNSLGHGGIVNRKFLAVFGNSKREQAAAEAFAAYLKAYPGQVDVEDASDVLHQRLTSLVKEERSKLSQAQLDILGAHIRTVARLTLPGQGRKARPRKKK